MHWFQCPDRKIQEAWRGGGAVLTYAAAIETRILMRADTWPLGKPTHLIGMGAPNTVRAANTQRQVQNGLSLLLLFQIQSDDGKLSA